MSLTFADTHNMVAYLNKSDASEGFNQIVDFLNGSYIKHALTINPHIYFWNIAVVKRTGYVTRLQALVDKKKIVISEDAIREILVGKGCSGIETPLFENMLEIRELDAEEEVQVPAHDDVIPAVEPVVAAVSTPISAAKLKGLKVTTTTASIPISAAKPVVDAVSTPVSAVKPKVLKIVLAAPTVSTRKRKGIVIRDPEEELHDDTLAETQSAKDKGKG
nr:hypothetical protein [Tanacetum cinerariifolium]